LKTVIKELLVLEPEKRPNIEQLKLNPLYSSQSIDYFNYKVPLWKTNPPLLKPFTPEGGWEREDIQVELQRFNRKFNTTSSGLSLQINEADQPKQSDFSPLSPLSEQLSPRSAVESISDKWKQFLYAGERIIYASTILKKRYFFSPALARYLILTDKPRMFYIDEENMQEKGEVLLDKTCVVDMTSDSKFSITVQDRVFLFEDPDNNAKAWCENVLTVVSKLK
jgi:hypothetical protein